ncbi:hypothetical protein [Streptomyces spectabilis]|uniref:SH3 domain-containing protein n=1 Tax=Streptomyces spectabilis TaxID=68270 RepID=A0A5P2WZL0_STRST|nr:hypothetical protein [Streptomyces spectabilis]MBB5109372.1 hypothetical protein [Streptomyces spectabilis]MCI3899886.1 hypothetical protein [Streptomyces spectabilis]QEV57538.1 hypothetical protein CP982_01375 [Streptomyces spectabilis]GGV42205.1 hypothetical protein GCM10010245_66220 [Streptomyces spectabilis]
MLSRTAISSALAAAALAAGALVCTTASAAPASADVNCTPPYHNNNSTGWGKLTGTYNLKKAPYASCGNVKNLRGGTKLYFHCYVVNAYGNEWIYSRVAGTETYGWMSYANFGEKGDVALLPCGS